MDIRTHTTPAPILSVLVAKPGEERDSIQAHRRVPSTADVKADNKVRDEHRKNEKPLDPSEERKFEEAPRVRLELRIDEDTKQVFGAIIDKETGEEIRQIPAESIRHLQAISRELFVDLIDESV